MSVCFHTDLTEVVQGILGLAVIHHSSSHQQREAVEQPVDGVPRLMDGQDDGATAVRHSEQTHRLKGGYNAVSCIQSCLHC